MPAMDLSEPTGILAAWLGGRGNAFPDLVIGVAVVVAAVLLALLLHGLLVAAMRRILPAEPASMGRIVLRRVAPLVRLALILGVLAVVAPALGEGSWLGTALGRILQLGAIALIGWAVTSMLQGMADIAIRRNRIDVEDNLLARKHRTQLRVLARAGTVLVALLTLGAMLLTFPAVREVGISLFASAGVAGLVFGLAARPVLSNLLAGIQIALTQPIRIEDAVVVEGEWGWIEEIGATYVVIRIWDWRRLIVPLSYFIEQPFQNWTRQSASIIGAVTWHLDHATPVGKLRAKMLDLLDENPLWDRDVAALQVIDTQERTITVRGLMSARNSPAAWDLRCAIREQVLAWLQLEHPEALPRLRTELRPSCAAEPAAERQPMLFPQDELPEAPPPEAALRSGAAAAAPAGPAAAGGAGP